MKNDDCDDLEKRKMYRMFSDEKAEKGGYVRMIDGRCKPVEIAASAV